MPRRTDSKARMVGAARDLFRRQGYVGTALSDVLEASSAPRGSVYFHFPGGKEELGTEVVLAHIADMNSLINRAALRVGTPGELLRAFFSASRERLVASAFRDGCAVAPIVLEVPAGSRLSSAVRQGLEDSVAVLAARLTDKGVPAAEASRVASAAWAALEGGLLVGRGLRSTDPFDALCEVLVAESDRSAGVASVAGARHPDPSSG